MAIETVRSAMGHMGTEVDAEPPPHMTSGAITVLFVGGTGESFRADDRSKVSGLLAPVADALDGRFRSRWIGYPASYGPAPRAGGMSFTDSVRIGVGRLRTAMSDAAGPLALVGYSQGAVVIRTALHEMCDDGDATLADVLAVGFIADPHQPPGAVPGCTGWGVAGPGPELPPGLCVWWVGSADDVICNADADSLVRDIADLTATISLTRLGAWLRSIWQVMRTNAFQNAKRTALRPAQWRRDIARLWSAWHAVRCYLPLTVMVGGVRIPNPLGGRHTSYRLEPYRRRSVTDPTSTGCEVIAQWLQVQATFAGIGARDPAA